MDSVGFAFSATREASALGLSAAAAAAAAACPCKLTPQLCCRTLPCSAAYIRSTKMEHATLSASLEAVLLRLAELTPAGAVVSEQAAVLLAGVASELGARPGSVDEAHQQADELRRCR